MARSSSEFRIPPSAASPPETRPEVSFGLPGMAPSAEPVAAGPASLPWTTAFTLGACAFLAFVVPVMAGAGESWPVAAAGAPVAAALVVTLAVLRRRHGALNARVAGSEHRAGEWQRYAEELERRVHAQEARNAGTVSALAEAADSAAGIREQFDGQIESYRLAVVTLARRLQASAHRVQEQATRMANRHPGDSDVLESSMLVDHAAAQQARHAQSLAVLCGEWPGQQWPQPLALLDVVRAAAGRIVAYRRVTVSGEPDVAARPSAVEPLIHLIAELLANATQSSPPTTQVLATVRTVQRGAVIEIDDGGVGLEEHHLEQAREVVSGRRLLGLGDLGEVPQTGLAVIGQYVRRHGFGVDLMPSPYGGVRAIVLVHAEMVENLEPAATPPPPQQHPARESTLEPVGALPGSLPQRRSRRDDFGPAGHGAAASAPSAEPSPPAQTPQEAGAWLAAYLQPPAGGPQVAAPGEAGLATGRDSQPERGR